MAGRFDQTDCVGLRWRSRDMRTALSILFTRIGQLGCEFLIDRSCGNVPRGLAAPSILPDDHDNASKLIGAYPFVFMTDAKRTDPPKLAVGQEAEARAVIPAPVRAVAAAPAPFPVGSEA